LQTWYLFFMFTKCLEKNLIFVFLVEKGKRILQTGGKVGAKPNT